MRPLIRLAFAFFVTVPAHAVILVEPYLGYAFGTARPTGIPSTHHDGAAFGARVGYQTWGAMAGIDYLTGRWTDSFRRRSDLTPSHLGIFVGYNLPILFRAYVGYAPIARLTSELDSVARVYDGGEAIKYGVGYTGLPFLSVNFEWTTTHYRAMDTEMYGVYLSLPLAL